MAGIFDGIRVLVFTNNLAGPCATATLADFGAEVIKVERPVAGDDSRGITPRIEGQSLTFIWCNRGKKSVELALDDPETQELLYQMIADCDVLVESFKPGLMKKFNLDYEHAAKINPKIIYCSISACGQTGGYRTMPGFDIIAQGMSGLMDLCGDPKGMPVKNGVTIGDYVGALNAFGAISAALFNRIRTGEGQYIDISLLDGLIACNTTAENAANLDAHPTRSGPHHATMAPYGIYEGKNHQSVIIAAFTPGMWTKLCNTIGKPELIKYVPGLLSGRRIRVGGGEVPGQIRLDCHSAAPYGIFRSKNGQSVIIAAYTSSMWSWFCKAAVMRRAPDLGENTYEVMEQYGWDKKKVDEMEAKWSDKFQKQ